MSVCCARLYVRFCLCLCLCALACLPRLNTLLPSIQTRFDELRLFLSKKKNNETGEGHYHHQSFLDLEQLTPANLYQ
ncbi:hypothetical protein PAPYR_1558 [Paratrimastix pyriformis]|uniref:Secreted protein n=1 Tax=Paratrimastix pyriformis TaxID=342808 RepID=A0ABQ8URW4_9EUKA|nr:hypothetical protein PAPYR_1558 [Paratrimastix pyriformis]